ncbi:DUF2790 domain-containing protein [Pseudomonas sp. NPDC089554]|uniref:DUF2790 domain-containing protein n=1 Tax=Pseudomonas sp. NPDC089554 TaxID=3390653 RepID=UPI003D01CF3C
MNILRSFVIVGLVFFTVSANAQNDINDINARLEKAGRDATARYAQSLNKPMPTLENYRYDMTLDIAKVVHVSQNVLYCGNVKSIMSYEDTNGKLHMVRYMVGGRCYNNK